MPIGIVSLNLIALFLIFSAILVFFSWRKGRSKFLRDFTGFLFGIAGASTCWAIGAWLISIDPKIAGYFHPLAGLSGGIGFLYFCHLALTFITPERKWRILGPLVFLFLITNPILWLKPPIPSFSPEGVVLWNIDFLPGFTLFITGILFTGLPVIAFVYLGAKSTERFIKLRSFLISLGIILYMGGGLAHNIVTIPKQYLFSDIFTFLGVALLLGAVYLKKILKRIK